MKTKPKSIIAYVLAFISLYVGGTIGSAIKSVGEDEAKNEIIGISFREGLSFFVKKELWVAIFQTTWVFAVTAIAAAVAAVLLAWLMFRSRGFARIAEPVVQILRPIPSIATIAIGALIIGSTSPYLGILVSFLGSLWPLSIAVLDVFRQIHPALLESTITLGKGPRIFYREVLWYASLPGLFKAFRLVAPITLLLTVTTEYFYHNLGGLGALLYEKHVGLEYPRVISIVAALSLLSVAVELLLERIEQFGCKWRVAPETKDETT